MNTTSATAAVAAFCLLIGCPAGSETTDPPAQAAISTNLEAATATPPPAEPAPDTCKGPYPSYWQDPAFADTGMWEGQTISDTPASQSWDGPVFKLSQAYPDAAPDDSAEQGWLEFEPWNESLSAEQKTKEARDYAWAVMDYLMAGNVENGANGGDIEGDWTLCNNRTRGWFHMPYQTYDPLAGREFAHGLTREAPVTFTLTGGEKLATTMWAVGFYNEAGGATLGSVWGADGSPKVPTDDIAFPNGTVVGKLLFNTSDGSRLPFLQNMPQWTINKSADDFCGCTPKGADGKPDTSRRCTLAEESAACKRSPGKVTLMQFDIAVRDARSPLGWVFGTFVADGQHKKDEPNPWRRISPLGLMWGNDTPPEGTPAAAYPADPRTNGFPEEVVFFEVADRINVGSNAGHLGCNQRLNGPADNPRSSCLSCHMTASVPDKNHVVPPLLASNDFSGGDGGQCVPGTTDKALLQADQVYFGNQACGTPFKNASLGGGANPTPDYASGRQDWISLDYSVQLSISLVQYAQWMDHKRAPAATAKAAKGADAAPVAPMRRLSSPVRSR